MKKNKFYTIPYDARNTFDMKVLRRKFGGIRAFGQWQALLGMLYEKDGTIDLSDEFERKVCEDELELHGEKLDEFIRALGDAGWIDPVFWERQQHVVSKGVADQLAYRKEQASNGKQNGKKKAAKDGDEPA